MVKFSNKNLEDWKELAARELKKQNDCENQKLSSESEEGIKIKTLYTKDDLEILGTIYHLVKEKGYTLSGAQEILKNGNEVSNTVEIINSLEKVKAFLLELKSKLPSETT